jgi:hypothetical protein
MPQQNVAHVFCTIGNVNLNSMSKIVIFHVVYAISVRYRWMSLVSPTCQWGEGEIPFFNTAAVLSLPP